MRMRRISGHIRGHDKRVKQKKKELADFKIPPMMNCKNKSCEIDQLNQSEVCQWTKNPALKFHQMKIGLNPEDQTLLI